MTVKTTEVDFNIHPATSYVIGNPNTLAMNMLYFAIRLFEKARCIAEFDVYKELHKNTQGSPEMQDFAMDNVVDNFKIVTAFENYMKAVLLVNDCVIHMINAKTNKQLKSLKEDQYDRPIYVVDLLAIEDFSPDQDMNAVHHGITNKTLQMSTMFEPEYQAVIKLPAEILRIITEYNDERNDLHFKKDARFNLKPEHVADVELLNEFVKNDMYKLCQQTEEIHKNSRTVTP